MQIAVVGSGYVGLVAGACFADLGHDVILVDNDQQKLASLKAGQVPIHENFLPELLQRHRGQKLNFSGDLQQAVRASAAIFIAVGTPPTEQGDADLSYIESVARSISGAINGYKVIVEKSTVPVYTSDWIRKIILRNAAPPDSFDVASNPEFLREGTAVTDFLYPDRIVVGADSERCASILREIYAPLTSGSYYRLPEAIPQPDRARIPPPLIVTSAKSAELIKHASNAFLAMKISFINAVANISEAVGADVTEVCSGVGSDSRIGPKFLNAGVGYGGSCFPKDVKALVKTARDQSSCLRILEAVESVNDDQKRRLAQKLRLALGADLKGASIAVWT
jgi:UDPglucose 6-dehydrogenase